jgi:hypothetical protein
MTKLLARGSAVQVAAQCFAISCLSVGVLAWGQQVAYPEQQVYVHDLAPLTARSIHSAAVLATSLEIVFHDKEVCCGKNSALEDSVAAANPKSLKDVASRLQGRHLLSDGRPIMVTAEFLAPNEVNAGHLVMMILNQHAPLMEWNAHVYVVDGVSYVETVDNSDGSTMNVIHKFFLQDVRHSDSRRIVTFDRLTDDAGKVEGLLFLQAAPQ